MECVPSERPNPTHNNDMVKRRFDEEGIHSQSASPHIRHPGLPPNRIVPFSLGQLMAVGGGRRDNRRYTQGHQSDDEMVSLEVTRHIWCRWSLFQERPAGVTGVFQDGTAPVIKTSG